MHLRIIGSVTGTGLVLFLAALFAFGAARGAFGQDALPSPLPGQSYLQVVTCSPGALVASAVPDDYAGCEVVYIERPTPACYAIKSRAERTEGFERVATAVGTADDINGLIGGKVGVNCIDGPSIPTVATIPPLPTSLPTDFCERLTFFLAEKQVTPDEQEINTRFGAGTCPAPGPPDPPPDAGPASSG